ncbi:unnamed protein product, partial [Dicrocoelium dendriticum]
MSPVNASSAYTVSDTEERFTGDFLRSVYSPREFPTALTLLWVFALLLLPVVVHCFLANNEDRSNVNLDTRFNFIPHELTTVLYKPIRSPYHRLKYINKCIQTSRCELLLTR